MVAAGSTLPDLNTLDQETLKELLRTTHEQLLSRESEIEHLKLLLAKLERMQFGRKSEKLQRQIEQLELRLEDLEQAREAESEPPTDSARCETADASAQKKPARRALPSHLPRVTRNHAPQEQACPGCGGKLRPLGEDVSEMLEYVPAHFKVIRHVRPKLSCASCQRIVQPLAPSRPIERGIAGPGLIAHVLVSKYCDHLPLYRQSQIYAREGIDLDRSTLADWVGGARALLEPLVRAIGRYALGTYKIHADDTPVPVLFPGRGTTKQGRLWTYVRDDRPAGSADPPAVFFRYSPDRKGERPRAHLANFSGVLQADAYAGFDQLYGEKIKEAACWAHVRRKFYDIHVSLASPIALEALERIGRLYKVEEEIRGRQPHERHTVRQARAGPELKSLHEWLHKTATTLSKKSELAKAIRYALSNWVALTRYCEDGRLEVDNNAAERALRAVALGRKNWLFAGSDDGGERAAAIYTLLGTAKLNHFNPESYLRYVLERIADHPINQIEELLPWNLVLKMPELRIAA